MLEVLKNRLNEYIVQYITEIIADEISGFIDEFVEGLLRRISMGTLLVPPVEAEEESQVVYDEPEITYDPDEAYVQAA